MVSSPKAILDRVLIVPKEPDLFILNRQWDELGVWIKEPENPHGVAFISHGLIATARQPEILKMRDALVSRGIKVISYDASNHQNYSDGSCDELTWASHLQDLKDVVDWAKDEGHLDNFPKYIVAGRSLGAFVSLQHAANYPEEVSQVIALSPPVTGKKTLKIFEAAFPGWKKDGFITMTDIFNNIVKAPYKRTAKDLKKHNLLKFARKLTMPVLLMDGDYDSTTPHSDVEELFKAIPEGNKTFVTIPYADHYLLEPGDMELVCKTMQDWLAENLPVPSVKKESVRRLEI
jgi:alpha-beta hydrolase superfamily lysophospholipase